MAREIKQEHEIIDHINGLLACIDEIMDCQISGIQALQGTDDDGCNWSVGYINIGGNDPDLVASIISGIIDAAKKQFNMPG